MEQRIEALEEELKQLRKDIKAWEVAHAGLTDGTAQVVYWLGNLQASLLSKGVLDEGDIAAIEDTKKAIGQFREDIIRNYLLEQADEGKVQ